MPHDKKNSMETAQYIADLALELRNMAKAAELTRLQDFLEMAYYEAFSAAQGNTIPAGEAERLERMAADAKRLEKS